MVLIYLAFRYVRGSTNFVSMFVFAAKIFDFCASLGDAGTRVPARKLHTRPGYINTRIVPGLFASCQILSERLNLKVDVNTDVLV